jgi:hypothetical protein
MFGQLQSIATGHMNVNDNYVGINRVEKNNAVGSTKNSLECHVPSFQAPVFRLTLYHGAVRPE